MPIVQETSYTMRWHPHHLMLGCRRAQPAWSQLLRSQDFRAIASLNAVMFATTNGARSMLMPLLAVQQFGMSATSLGEPALPPDPP